MSSAYLLVSHGSRDSRPQAAAEALARWVSQSLMTEFLETEQPQPLVHPSVHVKKRSCDRPLQPPPASFSDRGRRNGSAPTSSRISRPSRALLGQPHLVGTSTLELAPVPLHVQIQQFATRAFSSGYSQLKVVPLFLLPGVHVMEDIPAEIEQAKQALKHDIKIEVTRHIGSHPQLPSLLSASAPEPGTAKVLISHGSRRAGGNRPVEAIAHSLNAKAAYWSVPPSLESQIQVLAESGYEKIIVLPYFLFPGGLTDAIAQQVHALSQQFPQTTLHMESPLGASPTLAKLVADLTREPSLTPPTF